MTQNNFQELVNFVLKDSPEHKNTTKGMDERVGRIKYQRVLHLHGLKLLHMEEGLTQRLA